MPTKPKINVRLLRRIQKQIAKEPRQFEMTTWFAIDARAPNCGTTACIAGWALACSAKLNPLQTAKSIRKTFGGKIVALDRAQARYIEPAAAKALGLTAPQAERLFHVDNWPINFLDAHWAGLGCWEDRRGRRAANAIRRSDHFIATGGES